MNLGFISYFFKKYIIVLVIFIFIFGGAGYSLYKEYKENQRDRDSIYALKSDFEEKRQDFEKYKVEVNKSIYNERIVLSDLKNEFEKNKNKENIDLIEKRNSIEKREKELDEKARDLELKYNELKEKIDSDNAKDALLISEKSKELDRLIAENNEKLKNIEFLHKQFSEIALREKAETKLQELMGKFTVLGVDLSYKNICDKEGMKLYRQADSLLNQMLAIINSQKVGDGYHQFVRNNRSSSLQTNFACN